MSHPTARPVSRGERDDLNTIGKPYHAVAVMLGNAYRWADEMMNADGDTRAQLRRDLGIPGGLTRHALAMHYVEEHQADRRYRLFPLAGDGNMGAIVRYQGIRYLLTGVYDPHTKRRTYYVSYAR
jgi:hypothetical protein